MLVCSLELLFHFYDCLKMSINNFVTSVLTVLWSENGQLFRRLADYRILITEFKIIFYKEDKFVV